MSSPIVISILANSSQANRTLNQTATVTQKVGRGFQKMAIPAVAALGAIGAGAKAAIDSASDLEETIAKTGEIFGPQAKQIEKFAARAEKALGQSKTAALDAASNFGIIAESAGLTGKETAEFSKKFVTLASDMASFNNTSPEQAVTAIGAAMRGEAEPIRKYGVLLDDATLRNRALKLGLIDNVKQALTPQQKALAASEEILKQTTKAQGDFARTSDGAANKSRIQAAQAENLKAKLGKGLLPVYIRFQEILIKVIDYLSKHEKETKLAVAAVAGLAAAVLAVNAAMKLATAATTVYTAVQKAHTFAQKQGAKAMLATRGGALAAGGGLLYMSTQGKLGDGALSKVATTAGAVATGFALGGPFGAVVGAGAALIGLAGQSEESARRQQAFLDIQRQVNGQAEALVTTLNEQTGAITNLTRETVRKNLADAGAFTAAQKVGVSFTTVTRAALGHKKAQRQVADATEAYILQQGAAADGLKDFSKRMDAATEATAPLTEAVKTYSGRLDKAKTATRQVNRAQTEMVEKARDSATKMRGAGSDAGQGFRDGVGGWLGRIRDIGQQIADTVAKAAADKLEIESPSRVFRRLGEFTGQGFAQGIESSSTSAVTAIDNLVTKSTKAVKSGGRLEFDIGFGTGLNSNALVLRGGSRGGDTYNITVKLDSSMTEIEMGRAYQNAINAARRVGAVQ